MKRWILLLIVLVIVLVLWRGFGYRYVPAGDKMVSRTRPASGGDAASASYGREQYYGQTFGNEVFLTDIMGILDGPLRPWYIAKAILKLNGAGTDDLIVECAADATIGGRQFRKGEPLHTGIDVPRGAWAPLGMPMFVRGGRILAGITCAACHSTVDRETGKVIDGAANLNLNTGLLLAMATNSASYFMHTDVDPREVPDPVKLEEAVDEALLQWQPGTFDSMVDMVQATTRIPTSWTLGNHPYSWSGAFAVGPFRGLSAQNNNVHALNSDSLILADAAPVFFGLSKDEYLTILLRNAASKRYRYDPQSGKPASEFFHGADPNPGAPGVNQIVLPPTFPKSTAMGPDGAYTSSPGQPFFRQLNAMSVFQNTLRPPVSPVTCTPEQAAAGRAAFERAGCAHCHSGQFLTDNRVHPVAELGTDPARARALGKTEMNWTAPPVLFDFSEPVPIRQNAPATPVPLDDFDPLAWNHRESGGGYKTPALVGLHWNAPYLHDGGVPTLEALVDREARAKVVQANAADPAKRATHVSGVGHEFWVPPADQEVLIRWLLSFETDF
jgi:hypothetical protein